MRLGLPLPRYSSVPAIILLLLSLGGCDEPLPKYSEPVELFDVQLKGEYSLGSIEHCFKVYVHVTNIFDETLEGPASLVGTVEVFASRDGTVRKTLSLSRQSLVRAPGYNPSTGTLRIQPQETIILKATWNFVGDKVIDDSGRDLTEGAAGVSSFFRFVADKSCAFRMLARPEDFVLRGHIEVFQKRGLAYARDTVFPFCFITRHVDSKTCPTIITDPPCTYWPGLAGQ